MGGRGSAGRGKIKSSNSGYENYSVKHSGRTDKQFKDSIANALQDLRDTYPGVLTSLREGGVTMETGLNVIDVRPDLKGVRPRGYPAGYDWNAANGLFSVVDSKVVVTQQRHGKRTTNADVKNTALHELGHGFAKITGMETDEKFLKVYNAEAKRARKDKSAGRTLSYFLQSGRAGASEAIAQGFAESVSPGGFYGSTDFQKFFPKTMNFLQKEMKKKGKNRK